MPVAESPAPRIVLHVRPDGASSASTDNVSAGLAAASLAERIVSDVYHALAFLGGSDAGSIVAVLVRVDGLASDEWEFFTVTARRSGGPKVYVYGDGRLSAQLARAVELGAAGRVTDELLRRLAAESSPPPVVGESRAERVRSPADERLTPSIAPPASPSPAPALIGEPEVTAEFAAPGESEPSADTIRPREAEVFDVAEPVALPFEEPITETEPLADETPGEELGPPPEEEESEPAVRLPWMRYADRPARSAPSAPTPPTPPPQSAEARPPRRPMIHEPLLTEEELRALLGDDIAAIAPRPRSPDHNSAAREEAGPP